MSTQEKLRDAISMTLYSEHYANTTESSGEKDMVDKLYALIAQQRTQAVQEVLEGLKQYEMTLFNRNDTLIHAIPLSAITEALELNNV